MSSDATFSAEESLGFAVGFTAYDSVEEPILDPSIGELVFNAYEWGPAADGTFFSRYISIPSHTCSEQELGLVHGHDTSFLPLKEENLNDLKTFRKKMRCIDRE